jgi:hypothetical protein
LGTIERFVGSLARRLRRRDRLLQRRDRLRILLLSRIKDREIGENVGIVRRHRRQLLIILRRAVVIVALQGERRKVLDISRLFRCGQEFTVRRGFDRFLKDGIVLELVAEAELHLRDEKHVGCIEVADSFRRSHLRQCASVIPRGLKLLRFGQRGPDRLRQILGIDRSRRRGGSFGLFGNRRVGNRGGCKDRCKQQACRRHYLLPSDVFVPALSRQHLAVNRLARSSSQRRMNGF